MLFFNHSFGDLSLSSDGGAHFIWLALADHENWFERAVLLIVKHIKLMFVILHVLFYHSLVIRLLFALLILQLRRLKLKMLELLFVNVSWSLEILLRLRDVHALLRKFVTAKRLRPVQCGLWWTLSCVWIFLLRDRFVPILFNAFAAFTWQLSWVRAPLGHHAFEIR